VTKSALQQKANQILALLEERYPKITIPLNHENAHQLLFATILSAQCTDVRVNLITPKLFARYSGIKDFAEANPEELGEIIRPCGLYRSKAKNIIGAAQKIMRDFGGEVPGNFQDLTSLPGVAKKTATVVLWQWFDINAGFTVDTHVLRLSKWFGLTKNTNPDKVAHDLEQLFPQEKWGPTSLRLIFLGRELLTARSPKHLGSVWEKFMVVI
jgi:endonuclease-3